MLIIIQLVLVTDFIIWKILKKYLDAVARVLIIPMGIVGNYLIQGLPTEKLQEK